MQNNFVSKNEEVGLGVARDTDTRDNYLLGAAALAIGAAAVVGYWRREN